MPTIYPFNLVRSGPELEAVVAAIGEALKIANEGGVDVGELLEKSQADRDIESLQVEMWALQMYEKFLELRRDGRV